MADTIIVRCYKCGHKIGEITFVSGEQRVGCPECGAQTDVKIDDKGRVKIS